MRIINISQDNEKEYFCCLEEWSDEIKEAGDHKQRWYERMKDKGVRVKFAQDDDGVIGGMIQYMPVEHSIFEGRGLYAILCIWVHGYKQGRGDYRRKGMGTALLKTAEEDCKDLGAKGMITWGLAIPVWMRASWFKSKGYKVVDKDGINRLLWKPFMDDVAPPGFIKPKKLPQKGKGKVNVTIFRTGWCPVMNLAYERTIRASKEFGDRIETTEYDTLDKQIVEEWGITDRIFLDGREIRTGPPPSYEKIRNKLEKRVRRIK
jgi:GNAT superfamily N-acetyltransferase